MRARTGPSRPVPAASLVLRYAPPTADAICTKLLKNWNTMPSFFVEEGPQLSDLDCRNKQRLVERFNVAIGTPNIQERAFQRAFIAGLIASEEASAYIWFAEHMISAADKREH